ncbi:MAG: DNA polymerase/3'-5' exonuclease PolX [Gemmatimonadales bacterium]
MTHAVENAEIARLLREMADVLELQDANPFRVRAYRNAARTVEELASPVAVMLDQDGAKLRELPGIGEDLAGKIAEISRTGELGALRKAARGVPAGARELMRLSSIGPKRARALAESIGVRTLPGLARAARAGRLRTIRGFGPRTEERILRELAARPGGEVRLLRARATQYADALAGHMRAAPGVGRVEVVGSFRRCRETVGDLDVLAESDGGRAVIAHFVAYPEVAEVLAQGSTKASVRLRSGLHVDLRVIPAESFGAALVYFTGSKAHNIVLRRMGRDRGLKINEYGVFRGARRVAGRDEEEIYRAVGLPWIAPELREDRGEVEAAHQGTLPALLDLDDIRGDLHAHTTSTDGSDTLEAMADAAETLGYDYLAVTDHTARLKIVHGMDRDGFRRQMRRIDRLNSRLRRLTLLKGAEVDILADGSLDLDDDTLRALDIVLVSIHSKFDLPPAEQTRRVVRALSHPSVDVFAHPTGRIIERRRGAEFDFGEVCRVAAGRGVLLEVNAQPERLDLDDVCARAAVEHGVHLVVSTDAHATAELRFMSWGVGQARRGWAEKKHVANTLPLGALLKLLHRRR